MLSYRNWLKAKQKKEYTWNSKLIIPNVLNQIICFDKFSKKWFWVDHSKIPESHEDIK